MIDILRKARWIFLSSLSHISSYQFLLAKRKEEAILFRVEHVHHQHFTCNPFLSIAFIWLQTIFCLSVSYWRKFTFSWSKLRGRMTFFIEYTFHLCNFLSRYMMDNKCVWESGGINTLIDMKYLWLLVPHLSTLF